MTDMSNPSAPIRIALDPHETLPEVIASIREARGQPVVLAIPDHSPVLLTATEFRTLKEIADQSNVTLSLETDDRLRVQLASMFGLMSPKTPDAETDGWRPEPTALGSSRAFGTWRQRDGDTKAREKTIDAASMPLTSGGTGTRRRRLGESVQGGEPARRSLRTRSQTANAEVDADGELDTEPGALSYLDDRDRRLTARMIGRIVAVVIVLLLIGGIAGWFYMPQVTVSATLKQAPVSTDFIYSVAAPGAVTPSDASFSLPAEQGAATVPFTMSMPATGTKATPDKTASGSLTLRNPGKDKVNVPAGTKLASHGGVTYVTTSDVEVPAAKNDGAEPGETTVEIRAEQPGSAGNQDAGYLTGKIDDLGIYFSNRNGAVEGGTDIEVTVVSQDDIDKLEEQVPANLPQAAAKGWQETLTGGQAIVAQSVKPDKPTYTVDQKPGDEAENVTLHGTVAVTGLLFTQADVEKSSQETAEQLLAPLVPQGYALQPSTITFGEPKVLAEAIDSVQFQVTATGAAQAVFDQGAQDQLATDLAGTDWSDAERRVQAVDAFATSDISRSPGWWPKGMPQTESRIKVEIDHSVQPLPAPDGAGTPTADETPVASGGS